MVGKEGGEVSRAAGTDPRGRGRERSGGWLFIWLEEVVVVLVDKKVVEWRVSWVRVFGLVVRERGWVCFEWVVVGVVGEVKVAEGVAGEFSMLSWEEVGLL